MKKFIKIPLIIVGSIFGIFVILLVIGAVLSSSDNSPKDHSTEKPLSEVTSQAVLTEQRTTGINYSDYENVLMGYELQKLAQESSQGSKWSIVLTAMEKQDGRNNLTAVRVSNGAQYIWIDVPNRLMNKLNIVNAFDNYYLFLVDVKVNNDKTRIITAVDIFSLEQLGMPNDNDALKSRTPRDFDTTMFIKDYLSNINNPDWINPIKQLPNDPSAKYNDYLKRLSINAVDKIHNGSKGYFLAEVITVEERNGKHQWQIGLFRQPRTWVNCSIEFDQILGNNFRDKQFLVIVDFINSSEINVVGVFDAEKNNINNAPTDDLEMDIANFLIRIK